MSQTLQAGARGLDDAAPLVLAHTSLFLDLDGTLAPIMSHPGEVGPKAERNALLRRLSESLGGRLAVVSGRSIADIDRILEGAVIAVAGVHGLERRDAKGGLHRIAPHPALARVAEELRQFAAALPGVLIEDKTLSLAVHFRAEPGAAHLVEAQALRIAAANGLAVQPGDHVVELKTPGHDKGDALRAFMADAPFAGARPIFVGDDLTDEAAFGAAASLGGFGVLVGRTRPSLARRQLSDPEAVLDWLRAAVMTAGAEA